MLISSHRLDEVAALVNRVVELDQGKVVLDDRVADAVDMAGLLRCRVRLTRSEDAFARTIREWGFHDAGDAVDLGGGRERSRPASLPRRAVALCRPHQRRGDARYGVRQASGPPSGAGTLMLRLAALLVLLTLVGCSGEPETGPPMSPGTATPASAAGMVLSDRHYGAQSASRRRGPEAREGLQVRRYRLCGALDGSAALEGRTGHRDLGAGPSRWPVDRRALGVLRAGKTTPMEYGWAPSATLHPARSASSRRLRTSTRSRGASRPKAR